MSSFTEAISIILQGAEFKMFFCSAWHVKLRISKDSAASPYGSYNQPRHLYFDSLRFCFFFSAILTLHLPLSPLVQKGAPLFNPFPLLLLDEHAKGLFSHAINVVLGEKEREGGREES